MAKRNVVYVLTCEDASHLGGPMGTEYTTHLWTRVFSTLASAKDYASKTVSRQSPLWEPRYKSPNKVYWDSGAYIFTIKTTNVE